MLDYKNGISLVFFFSILLSISILVIISFCPFLRAFTHLSCTIEQNQTILDGLLLSDFFSPYIQKLSLHGVKILGSV